MKNYTQGYTPRLVAPAYNNKNYIHYTDGGYNYCIEIENGSCLPNCVGYAWGRWRELLGKKHNLSLNNAENWYGNTNDGYKRGSTPKIGAVICWRKGQAGNSKDGAGHVAIVEEIKADGSIVISNSDYSGRRFYTTTLKKPYSLGGTFTLQGFIYIPIEFEEEKPTPNVKEYLPSRGYFKKGDSGAEIHKICEFFANNYYSYFGNTKNTAKIKLLGTDGKGDYFGPNLYNWTKEYQKRRGLEQDGNIGPLTLADMVKNGFSIKE